MKTDVFPLNYFKSTGTPVRAFANRHQLGWLGIFVVFLFLNALLTIPVTVHFAGMDTFPLEQVYPKVSQMLEEHSGSELQQAEYGGGQMKAEEPFVHFSEVGVLAGGVDETKRADLMKEKNVVLFEDTHLLVKEENLPVSTVPYTEDFSLEESGNGKAVVEEVGRQWFAQNQVFVVAFFSMIISAFLFVMLLFLVFGSAVFLYLTKSSPLTSISTYKESVNLLLNVLALPTLAAMVLGLIQFDIIWMLMTQTVGLVILLLVMYYKTRFSDATLNMVVQE